MKFFLEGFLLQASLILALGAQNIFVLESGMKRQRQYVIATVCSLCDIVLVLSGVLGVSSLFLSYPVVKIVFGVVGVAFLLLYGIRKFISGVRKEEESYKKNKVASSVKEAIFLSLAFSLLNPHVYLDTLILIGGYASKFELINHRFIFGIGAGVFSTLWFFSLAGFSSILGRVLKGGEIMHRISLVAGLILIILAVSLGVDVYHWIDIFISHIQK